MVSNPLKFKAKIHVPTKEYAFIEVEVNDTIENMVALHDEIANKALDKEGLSVNDWAKARNKMLVTGEFDPNLELSKAQRFFVNELKKALRAVNSEIDLQEEVIKNIA